MKLVNSQGHNSWRIGSGTKGILLLVVLFGTACHPWYLVESRFVDTVREARAPEVTGTEVYNSKFHGPLRVALRAPDTCANQSSAQASGAADPAGELIRTDCGVEMAEMERALAKAGYTVSSWNAVSSIVKFDHITPIKAAKRLGAQILFQVNSLEKSQSEPGRDLRKERLFFESDKRGKKLGEAFVEEKRALTLERMMVPIEDQHLPRGRMSATVNVSAVDVDTGQSVWFYEWTAVEEREQLVEDVTRLFLCNRKHMHVCFLRSPYRERDDSIMTRSGGVAAESVGDGKDTEQTAIYHRLVREVVADLVIRFTDDRG